ncbi:hypothetical protein FACS189421_06910 [Bacteroidia bacterium]|nr:hypothetical protein FACS189421_06910 [Bacteroidia bacterium]
MMAFDIWSFNKKVGSKVGKGAWWLGRQTVGYGVWILLILAVYGGGKKFFGKSGGQNKDKTEVLKAATEAAAELSETVNLSDVQKDAVKEQMKIFNELAKLEISNDTEFQKEFALLSPKDKESYQAYKDAMRILKERMNSTDRNQ